MNLRTDLGNAEGPVPPPAAPRRRRTLIVVIAVAALAAASAIVIAMTGRSASAETVERYLTALLERDVAAALDEVWPNRILEDEKRSTFLDEAAMRTDWSFGSIDAVPLEDDRGRRREDVTVELSGFGQTDEAVFTVLETGDGWQIENPFAEVSFELSSLTYLDIDGVRVADSHPVLVEARPTFPVFPGTHRFFESLPEGVELTSPDAYDVLLRPASAHFKSRTAEPVPELTLGGELEDQAQRQIKEIIDACAESPEMAPDVSGRHDYTRFCPFLSAEWEELEDGTRVDVEEPIEWSVTEYPVFELVDPPKSANPMELVYGGFRALVEEPGTISAVMSVRLQDEGLAEPEEFTAVIECEFEPDGFRSRLTEDDSFLMYFISVSNESEGATLISLTADGCTHSLEEQ